jgi:hypothetical protein
MKKIILLFMLFLLMGCVCADDFSKVNVNGVDFEIPNQYSSGSVEKTKYVYGDLRTFAILCVDDYIISNYGGFYDIADYKQELSIDSRPVKLLTMYNKYIDKNVSYLYFPVNKSVYCICFQGDNVSSNISHIVESAPSSDMSSDTFYGLLDEAYAEHENRQFLDRLADDDSYYVSKTHEQQKNGGNDQLVRWYLLSHW